MVLNSRSIHSHILIEFDNLGIFIVFFSLLVSFCFPSLQFSRSSLVLLLVALTVRYPSLVVVNSEHSLGLPSLLSDPSAKTPEVALVYIFGEARRTTPSILYLPQFDIWWETAHEQLRAEVVLAEVEDVPHLVFSHRSVYL
ncbi:uncharacterized protein [Arachis hypogaea]|uniref:uncharacterized protein isoform X7 n=1 Tax=Arachis hypogaea TaxID=3818 RepID=UPI003B20EFD0